MSRSLSKFLDSCTKEDREVFFDRDYEIKEFYSKLYKANLNILRN